LYTKGIINLEKISNTNPILFIILVAITTFLFLPITPMSILAGISFGGLMGSIYTLLGATIGATILFEITRLLGRDFMYHFIKSKSKLLHNLNEKVRHHGIKTTFFLRIIHFPYNLLNILLGLTKIHTKDFIIGTILGAAPTIIALAYFGNSIKDNEYLHIILPAGIVLLFIIGYLSKKRIKKIIKKKKR
tara:strand:- start:697 stop:1266 length:570 start_codon:yes stop_codon:yes gene_type:complete